MIPEIIETQKKLVALKHKVVPTFKYVNQLVEKDAKMRRKARKLFLKKIKGCDALLVLNRFEKKGRKNYISGCSFLEMGFAYALNKKIFLFQGMPDVTYKDEILAVRPKVLGGNLSKIR